ncbi:hypothetical protein PG993_006560 [Apiospora rasikravindrae]|uniref:Uncharacterized protein n=1 Tax=Apiospora rasikravindrae TaxID=990691 RepID=A0ABR1T6J1_9PEZI
MCYSEELTTVCSECRTTPTRKPKLLRHRCFDVLKHKRRYGACGRAAERPFTTIVRSGVCRGCRSGKPPPDLLEQHRYRDDEDSPRQRKKQQRRRAASSSRRGVVQNKPEKKSWLRQIIRPFCCCFG